MGLRTCAAASPSCCSMCEQDGHKRLIDDRQHFFGGRFFRQAGFVIKSVRS